MSQKNMSKQSLLRFLRLNIKNCFTVCAVKRFKNYNTKLDRAEFCPKYI